MDEEALLITEQLLSASPDFYTIWNYRREIILEMMKPKHTSQVEIEQQDADEMKADSSEGDGEEAMKKFFSNELRLTATCLMKNPKSYCAWHQRAWIIEHMPQADLNKELMLCKQFLEMDERNCKSKT